MQCKCKITQPVAVDRKTHESSSVDARVFIQFCAACSMMTHSQLLCSESARHTGCIQRKERHVVWFCSPTRSQLACSRAFVARMKSYTPHVLRMYSPTRSQLACSRAFVARMKSYAPHVLCMYSPTRSQLACSRAFVASMKSYTPHALCMRSPTRLNWHVAELAAQKGGVVIVDATRNVHKGGFPVRVHAR
eukprot:381597-Pelagomonas_calceolata.AAC.3